MIKISCPWVGSGTDSDPYRPAVYDEWQDAVYKLLADESDDPTADSASAICWIDCAQSDQSTVDAIASESDPVASVLADQR